MPTAGESDVARPGGRARPLTVSQLVRGASRTLERTIGTIWVEGETASVSRPSSGHIYFNLRDDRSTIKAVMWRSDARRLSFAMTDGLHLRCRGRLGVYEQSGIFQIYVQLAEPAGLGADALALEQLREKLAAEGLFETARKRPLPHLPRRIGVVTSRSGAAVRDVIRAVQRRFPVPILVADAQVQGNQAPAEILRALDEIARTDVDVVIVGRGGGSKLDLSAFNDERVVRAVAGFPVPVISAVGHEVDVSLTDLAADVRAATPTMAGEMAVPVRADLAAALAKEARRLDREMALVLRDARRGVQQLADAMESRARQPIARGHAALGELARRLERLHPRAQITAHRAALGELEARAGAAARRALDGRGRALATLSGRLQAMSPLQVLERGYAVATAGGHVVTDAAGVAPGDAVEVRLARGMLDCRVEAAHPGQGPRSENDG